jgi:hypothetical protein
VRLGERGPERQVRLVRPRRRSPGHRGSFVRPNPSGKRSVAATAHRRRGAPPASSARRRFVAPSHAHTPRTGDPARRRRRGPIRRLRPVTPVDTWRWERAYVTAQLGSVPGRRDDVTSSRDRAEPDRASASEPGGDGGGGSAAGGGAAPGR